MESNHSLVKPDAGNFFPACEFENRAAAQAKPRRDFLDRVETVEVEGGGLTGHLRFATCIWHEYKLHRGIYRRPGNRGTN